MIRFELLFDSEDEDRRESYVKSRINFEIGDNLTTIENYRLSKTQIEYVLSKIGERLQYDSRRNNCLSPLQQLLCALHWFGNGAQYHGLASMHGISQSTVCRVVHRVANAIIEELFANTVCWPQNCSEISTQFCSQGGFPQVAGCIDGTMITIDAPTEYEEQYVNKHDKHALNAMMVCGPDRSFYALNVSWPGSVPDARVLRNSRLAEIFSGGYRPFPNAIILGDSAYPLTEWLITPLQTNPEDPVEQRFNQAHKKTRRIIANSFAILKGTFPCLNHLRLKPRVAGKIVIACCILHNIEVRGRTCTWDINDDDDDDDNEIYESEFIEHEDEQANPNVAAMLNNLKQFFSNTY